MDPKYQNNAGICVPEIVFPKEGVDLTKWACVACDQYTSQPDYWEGCENVVGDAPSTLRIMLPEIYLEKPGEDERIAAIRKTMDEYMANGTLRDLGEGFMLTRRTVDGKTRTGLVVALDLECYDYNKGSTTLIRATEGTIVERIPPRLRIRDGAPLELPHILVLIDDEKRTVIEPIFEAVKSAPKFYDFELMQNGGHIEGWFINDEATIKNAIDALTALIDPMKYGREMAPLLFAMGDGNHSFATAKANWEKLKATLPEEERENHPARYALVELENVHDEGIVFEPIHRVVFNVSVPKFLSSLKEKLTQQNPGGIVDIQLFESERRFNRNLEHAVAEGGHVIPVVIRGKRGFIAVRRPSAQLEVGTLQNALDAILKATPGATIDYIHGADVVCDLGSKLNNIGFLLPAMDKSAFFKTVVFDGALPRKTFSMGEAHEKRYYLECRKITK
ncbi:MAG: DUF1015 domain-containing protein [Clostridia bacterium]|jgi:uncharacterized protein (DUF1015 family)|nr:DUF1015 domain-containing protein [Clostridia bacterium]MBQ4447327.1 DUF1015 domain-containing protein [Clostridia bacterium]